MEIYVILCISYAIMRHHRYTRIALAAVKEYVRQAGLRTDVKFSPIVFSIVLGILVAIAAPIVIIGDAFLSREKNIELIARKIIQRVYFNG